MDLILVSSIAVARKWNFTGVSIFIRREDITSVLDGFTIQHGNMTGMIPENRGGGIYIVCSSPLIRNCIISDNDAGEYGGGIFSGGFEAQPVTGVSVHAKYGKIGVVSAVVHQSQPEILLCDIMNNTAFHEAWAFGGGNLWVSRVGAKDLQLQDSGKRRPVSHGRCAWRRYLRQCAYL